MRLQPISQITARPIHWLWPGRLPLGKLTILDGDPGLGKSMVALDLCARLTTARPLPNPNQLKMDHCQLSIVNEEPPIVSDNAGCHAFAINPSPTDKLTKSERKHATPANVIYLNAEDTAHDTIRPRLQAFGADLDHIFIPTPDDPINQNVSFPSHTEALDSALAEYQPRLLVIDPIVTFLDPSIQDSNDPSIRRALSPLTHLADKHACAILLIRHLNKRPSGKSLYRGTGSIGFLASCRTGWLVAPDLEHKSRRILAQTKNNLAPHPPSLVFEIPKQNPEQLAIENRPLSVVHSPLIWHGESPLTADQLLNTKTKLGRSHDALDRACDFLQEYLRAGPQRSRDIQQAAQTRELADNTVYRARRKLNIESKRFSQGQSGTYWWRLPHQSWPEHLLLPDDVSDLEPWLAPVRERFPPASPLDDLEV